MFSSYVYLIFAMLFFSGNFIVGKLLTNNIPPLTLCLLRWFFALIFLLPFTIKDLKKRSSLWKREWKPLIALSATGIVLFNSLLYLSVNYTTTVNASIIDAMTPVIASIIGYICLKERLTSKQLTGIAVSLIGAIWIITRGSWGMIQSFSFNVGDLTMLLAITIWAVYSIIIKKHGCKFPVYSGLVMTILIGIVFLTILAAFLEWRNGFSFECSLSTILGFAYLGIFPSALSFIAWNKAVKDIGPTKASVFFNLVPLFTALNAIVFLSESIEWVQILGGIMVLYGVYLSTKVQSVNEKNKSLIRNDIEN